MDPLSHCGSTHPTVTSWSLAQNKRLPLNTHPTEPDQPPTHDPLVAGRLDEILGGLALYEAHSRDDEAALLALLDTDTDPSQVRTVLVAMVLVAEVLAAGSEHTIAEVVASIRNRVVNACAQQR